VNRTVRQIHRKQNVKARAEVVESPDAASAGETTASAMIQALIPVALTHLLKPASGPRNTMKIV
jgi:hypothetical protein